MKGKVKGRKLCGGVVSREGLRELGRAMMEVLARSVASPSPDGVGGEHGTP